MPSELKFVLSIWVGLILWFTIGGLLRGIHDAWSPPEDKYGSSSGNDIWYASIIFWPITTVYMSGAGAVLIGRAASTFIRRYFK